MITDESIKNQTSEENESATYGLLLARATKTTRNKIKLKWKKVNGADGYLVYGNKCGKANKYKLIKSLSSNKTSYSQSKLKTGTYYKYMVVAYKLVDGKRVTIAVSKTIHAATTGKSYCNVKSVKVNKSKVSIKKGKSFTIKASEVKSGKILKKHRKICFESTNTSIATVNSKGKIVGKKKGVCYVYAYAQSGVYRKIKVTVK